MELRKLFDGFPDFLNVSDEDCEGFGQGGLFGTFDKID